MHVLDRLLAVATKVKAGFAGLDFAVAHGGGQIDAAAVYHRVGPTEAGHGRLPLDVFVLFGIPLKREIFISRNTASTVTPESWPVFGRRHLAKRQAKRGRGKQHSSFVIETEHGRRAFGQALGRSRKLTPAVWLV